MIYLCCVTSDGFCPLSPFLTCLRMHARSPSTVLDTNGNEGVIPVLASSYYRSAQHSRHVLRWRCPMASYFSWYLETCYFNLALQCFLLFGSGASFLTPCVSRICLASSIFFTFTLYIYFWKLAMSTIWAMQRQDRGDDDDDEGAYFFPFLGRTRHIHRLHL